jgi:hypothetical protein
MPTPDSNSENGDDLSTPQPVAAPLITKERELQTGPLVYVMDVKRHILKVHFYFYFFYFFFYFF